jgi:hypothetical protein
MPLPADGTKVKLGKGSLLLDTLTSDGDHQGFDFMGNATAITLSADVTKAQLFSSTERSAPLIAEAVTRIAYTLTATLSEYTLNNLKKFLLGTSNEKLQALQNGATKNFDGDLVAPGKYLDLEARQVTNVSIQADGSIALVAGTDYQLYADAGLIGILAGGAVEVGMDLVVTYDIPAKTIDQIRLARDAAPICHLLYLADDANQDGDAARDRLEIWRCSVAPEGELNVISDEFGSFQLTMGVLSDAANHPNDPFGTLDRVR